MTTRKKILLFSGLSLIVASLVFFLIPYLVTHKSWYWGFGPESGVIGEAIGGIVGPVVGFIGIILTFLAFYIQYKANEVQIQSIADQKRASVIQERQISVQQFENIFFKLLKLHRENVSEMSYRNSEGRNVIIKITNDFFEIVMAVQESGVIRINKLDDQDLINLSYTILFFGTDETVGDVLENRFFKKYSKIYDSIVKVIEGLRTKENPYRADKYYYNGHQSRLGHYFRHLYRTILYVHRNKFLTVEEKKDYIRILQAQLSNHEQVLLFFYSVSDLGLYWELGDNVPQGEKLITVYNLIENIPLGSIYGFKPRRYYPFVKLEDDFEIRM